ncbi:hypothetical protein LX36DRAFT_712653 [Colletotrichum falcatum]|nr:hypothetical protein LX36DRAFT_712653 [Colletotrichum falcatum]
MNRRSRRSSRPAPPSADPLQHDTAAPADTTPSTLRWDSLPAEIRLMILKQMLLMDVPRRRFAAGSEMWRYQRTRGKRAWPSVCAEWRDFFERDNFSSLRLTSAQAIDRCRKYVTRNRTQFVRRIHLQLELRTYGDGNREEAKHEADWNNRIFTDHLARLLGALSAWQTTGLTLEIGAASPSDELRLPYPVYPAFPAHTAPIPYLLFPSAAAAKRVLGNLLSLDPGGGGDDDPGRTRIPGRAAGVAEDDDTVPELPEVRAVTRLVVSRRYHRSFSEQAVGRILGSLPRLEQVSYEPWQGLDDAGQDERDRANEALLRGLPASTRRLALWEASRGEPAWRFGKRDSARLADAAVEASRRLAFFSACFAVDARHFFRGYYYDDDDDDDGAGRPSWPELTSLALTARDLTEAPGEEADGLLRAAGRAAERMPELRVLELWSGRALRGFLFRYEAVGGRTMPRVTVEATWGYRLSEPVLAAWRRAARALTGEDLEVEVRRVAEDKVVRDLIRQSGGGGGGGGSLNGELCGLPCMFDLLRLKDDVRVKIPY